MQKSCRAAGLLGMLAVLALATAEARAQAAPGAGDVFTAYGVPVDVEARTAAEARDIALVQGQRLGLAMVLRRLTLAEDWPRLPAPPEAEIAAMVDSIQVSEEKTSSIRYLGKLIIEFKSERVRQLLRRAALPFTESRARPTLVLPVLRRAGSDLLFEEENAWLRAWAMHQAPPDSLFPLLIPIGDLEDIATIDAGLALRGDAAAMQRISARYGATNVLVAAAALTANGLDLGLQWHGPLRAPRESQNLTAGTEPPDELMRRAVVEIAGALEERWKRETLLQFGQEAKLSARLPVSGLQEWVTVRRLLARNGMVRRFEVASVSRESVQLWLHYLGAPEQLATSLAQDNLQLVNESGLWVLSLHGSAGSAAKE